MENPSQTGLEKRLIIPGAINTRSDWDKLGDYITERLKDANYSLSYARGCSAKKGAKGIMGDEGHPDVYSFKKGDILLSRMGLSGNIGSRSVSHVIRYEEDGRSLFASTLSYCERKQSIREQDDFVMGHLKAGRNNSEPKYFTRVGWHVSVQGYEAVFVDAVERNLAKRMEVIEFLKECFIEGLREKIGQ